MTREQMQASQVKRRRATTRTRVPLGTLLLCLALPGCANEQTELPPKAPRPVSVLTLEKRSPAGEYVVSGAVQSWKTEQIGFEVDGRVQWVREPGEDVDRRISSPGGGVFRDGTALAQIDQSRYTIALESAKAQRDVAALERQSTEIRLNQSIPAEINSARADLLLAETEFTRVQALMRQNAASQSEYDQAANTVQTSKARIISLEADKRQTEGELKAAEAKVKSAEQAVRDAQRDLDSTTLYASYRGQISDVHVVPGSVVTPGSPVLTLQMMDPIKIEVELSAEQSRKFRRRRQVPISFQLPDGSTKYDNAFVYNVATSADPSTRTFSMTLLLINDKFREPLPRGAVEQDVARTADIWPLKLNRVVGVPEDILVVEENAIHQDAQGEYVYQVANASFGDTFPELLDVKRQPVRVKDIAIPFLGIWTFRQVEFINAAEVDQDSLIVGALDLGDQPNAEWTGHLVAIDTGAQWLLRPGDLVDVNLSAQTVAPGFYVPINAIYEESSTTSLFVVEDGVARRIPVETVMPSSLSGSALIEVRSPELTDGMQVVVGGVHYLTDGAGVQAIETEETPGRRTE